MRTPIVRTAEDESISQTVIMAVAEATDVDPIDLDPRISDVIDPDALDRLFETGQSEMRLKFSMAGRQVIVHADYVVVVSPDAIDTTEIERSVYE